MASASAESVFHVAPQPNGRATGADVNDAASYGDARLWSTVRDRCGEERVTVRFAAGDYVHGPLTVDGVGAPDRTLTIEGDPDGGTVFRALNEDAGKPNTGFYLADCRNVIVRDLHFTGPGKTGYISRATGQDILFERCSWIDLPNIRYGAAGSSGKETNHIAYRNCTFRRVGLHGGAHMIYNAYEPRHIYVIDCTFEDCAGDYVRWRDLTDYSLARGCSFRSTGTWPPEKPVHASFISVPLFVDADPGDEWFGTHFLIQDNVFDYDQSQLPGSAAPIRFLHSGYDPPGVHHLMTPEEGAILERGTREEKKALLRRNCNIDTDEVRVFGNVYHNVSTRATFSSRAAYGAKSRGWEGTVGIFDLFNRAPGTPEWVKD
jgi:hypothetical protein